jgi:hypothetical protein
MHSMELDDEDKLDIEARAEKAMKGPDYPWGLKIRLSQKELDKLGLDPDDVDAGDFVHLLAFARVTHVAKSDGHAGKSSDVELQIEKMAVACDDDDDEKDDEK